MDVTYKREHKIIIRSTKKVMGRYMEVKQMNTLFSIYKPYMTSLLYLPGASRISAVRILN